MDKVRISTNDIYAEFRVSELKKLTPQGCTNHLVNVCKATLNKEELSPTLMGFIADVTRSVFNDKPETETPLTKTKQ